MKIGNIFKGGGGGFSKIVMKILASVSCTPSKQRVMTWLILIG
jgi:hypothetical protein